VTLLFTDVEGSTRLLETLGDRYGEAGAQHRRWLRAAFRARGGVEVDTQGDSFFVAFARASDAVAAAAEIQRALAEGPVRVRIGIHTGEPIVDERGAWGLDVHRAARVMAAGHGGQVLISQTTRDLLSSDIELRDLGQHRLKDLTSPVRLFQLVIEGLPADFPPPRTLEARPNNLPAQPSSLIGRERELEQISALRDRPQRSLAHAHRARRNREDTSSPKLPPN
jgi:class 3 adenylate cyclase